MNLAERLASYALEAVEGPAKRKAAALAKAKRGRDLQAARIASRALRPKLPRPYRPSSIRTRVFNAVRNEALDDFERGVWNNLAVEVAKRAKRGVATSLSLPSKELEVPVGDILDPSEVSVWMMLVQLVNLLGWRTVYNLSGVSPQSIKLFMQHRVGLGRARNRTIWLLWSLHFHPSNLGNTFNLTTFGVFNLGETGTVLEFERNRIRRGFGGADFGRYPKDRSHAKLALRCGSVFYRSAVTDEVVLIEPRIPLRQKKVPDFLTDDEIVEMFLKRDQGFTQFELAEAFGVVQPYISLLCKQRRQFLLAVLPCLETPCPLDDADLAELRRVFA